MAEALGFQLPGTQPPVHDPLLIEQIETYAQDVVDTVREPLLILDSSLRVHSANRAFYQTFHVAPDETENRLIYELGNGQWDIPALRTLLEDIVPKSSVFNDFELEHNFPFIGRRVMLLNARRLRQGSHRELLVLAMEDVTQRRRAEAEVAKNANTLDIVCASDIGVMRADLSKVRQGLFNLVSNAAKFTHDGKINVTAERQIMDGNEWIMFRVTDTGIGLSAEQIIRLFQPFTQADASTPR